MKKPNQQRPCLLTVKDNMSLTPNMRRIVLTGSDLVRFQGTTPSSYVKLMFDRFGDPLSFIPDAQEKVLMRTYTVRKNDQDKQELHIDMALHGEDIENGPASHWAQQAKPGSTICVGGPGAGKPLFAGHDWVVFVGDLSSIPAIANYLEWLPQDTRGYAVLSVPSKEDIQPLTHPSKIDVQWLIDEDTAAIAARIESLPPLPGLPAYWVAAEFSLMRTLRHLLTQALAVNREQIYISSYWRKGRSEDQHKLDKKADSKTFEAAFTHR